MASIFDDLFPGDNRLKQVPSIENELFLAASRNKREKVVDLFAANSTLQINTLVNGFTALHMSAKKGYCDIAKLLLEYDKSTLSSRTSDGRTAALIAAKEGQLGVLQVLVSLDENKSVLQDKDASGNTILHFATWGGATNVVDWLLSLGCDPNEPNSEGMTALQFAAAGNYHDIVEKLLSSSRQDIHTDSSSGLNALHRAALHGSTDTIRQLLSASTGSFDPLAKSENGSIPLHYAAQHGHLEAVSFLLSACHDSIDVANEFGLTALHYACIG